jgi:murein DD-endopeptidase MepM/ murein hydrolase activator NlpD
MRARRPARSRLLIPALVGCFYAGIAVGWVLRALPAPTPAARVIDGAQDDLRLTAAKETTGASVRDRGDARSPSVTIDPVSASIGSDPIAELHHRHLRLPIDDAKIDAMKGQFDDRRGGGTRGHEAVDILADRNTPIRAIEDGTIAKLFTSKAGGLTIYQFDPTGRFAYYYAHLENYARGLEEGQHVSAGDAIGYVGTSGNAPKNTPHLHFAIFELTPEHHWWQGRPIDPYLVFHK